MENTEKKDGMKENEQANKAETNDVTENNTPKEENEALKKSKDMAKQAYNSAKDATKTALDAFKKLLADPVSKQKEVIEELDSKKVLSAGIVFIALYVILFAIGFLLVLHRAIGPANEFIYGSSSLGFKNFVQAFSSPVIGAGVFILGFYLISKFINKKNELWSTHIFSAGVALFPISCSILLVSIFLSIPFISYLLLILGSASFLLILNGSLETTYAQSKKSSLILISALLGATYSTHYIITSL